MFRLNEHPQRRLNPLTGEWILVSPHRTKRPWQGQVERVPPSTRPEYDPDCYLCPGNARAGGSLRNPSYTSTFVFENDFAALRPDTPLGRSDESGLLVAEAEQGICRVVCFSPRHDLTVSQMSAPALRLVVDTWGEQCDELGKLPFINYVQIFENRGEMMGCSNPHPHCQIWANRTLPNEVAREQASQLAHSRQNGACLLCDYLALERGGGRMVCENDVFAVVVPFWAVWPFETMVIAKRHTAALGELDDAGRNGLAEILCRITQRYDNLFAAPFPYSMGFHQRPADGEAHPEWHLHAHFLPPLLRSATVRKFMVGYEMLAMPQRDITPESVAASLREASE